MPSVVSTANDMILGMTPQVQPGVFTFVTTTDPELSDVLRAHAISTFAETEGLSLIVSVDVAKTAGLDVDQPMRCITLNVYSALDGVGLTAAVATELAVHAIPCNMVAAFHHDHVFVPAEMCDRAMNTLKSLQDRVSKGT